MTEIFVPGPLRNPKQGSRGHWAKHQRWVNSWRDRTAERLRVALLVEKPRPRLVDPRVPKRVHFLAVTANAWDDDNIVVGMSPMRDALKQAGIIHDDSKASGHTFTYDQKIDRANRGVLITWDLVETKETITT